MNGKTGSGGGFTDTPSSPPLDNAPRNLSHLTHRQLIGWLGLLLPILVVLVSAILPGRTAGGSVVILDSISSYWYTSATAIFVGALFALAMFLFAYRGYEDDLADRVLGKIAGLSALGVAFFPTNAHAGVTEPGWWRAWMATAHYASAVTLFLSFILFAVWLFRKTSVPRGEPLPPDKRRRNRVYLVCGLVMIASILWAGSAIFTHAPIFWPEAIALVAFAISWLVKGEAHRAVAALVTGASRSG